MGVLSIIVGVLLVIAGFACIFTPFATFLATGVLLGILLLVYGVAGIIRSIGHKAGILEWILNILAVIVGLVALFRPGGTLVIDSMILVLLAIWFLAQGVIQIAMAFQIKNESPTWYVGLIVGILGIIVGIICFVNPMVSAFTVGVLIAFFFIESGISLISLGAAINSNDYD